MRRPAKGSLSSEPKAPTPLSSVQVLISAVNSASVGILKPLGHGLLVPVSPCHKLEFCGERQSLEANIKLACPGTSVLDRVLVVPDVLI